MFLFDIGKKKHKTIINARIS